jgi:CDP-diacylglycerol--glycerol-3-phosphate 3-phosphatidyltransferase
MPSVYDIKPAFQRLLRPVVRLLARLGVTANQVTVAATLLSLLVGIWVLWLGHLRWPLLLVPVTLLVRMALNAIDGMLAREHKLASRLGAILNELGDVFSDTFLYLPLAVIPGVPAWLVVAIVIAAIINEMTGIVALQVGAERRYDGPMGKSDRAVALGALYLALGFGAPTTWWVPTFLGIVLALALLTIWNRAHKALTTVTRTVS